MNIWYLDDGILRGSPSDLRAALDVIEREGPRGLFLNRSKCIPYSSADTSISNPLPNEVSMVTEGLDGHRRSHITGSSYWPSIFCNDILMKRVSKLKALYFAFLILKTLKWKILSSDLVYPFLKFHFLFALALQLISHPRAGTQGFCSFRQTGWPQHFQSNRNTSSTQLLNENHLSLDICHNQQPVYSPLTINKKKHAKQSTLRLGHLIQSTAANNVKSQLNSQMQRAMTLASEKHNSS